MANFGSLQTEVNTLLIDAPAAVQSLVPSFINRAIRDLQDDYNYRVMEGTLQYNTTSLTRVLGTITSNDRVKEFRDFPYMRRFDGTVKRLFWLPGREDAFLHYTFGEDDTNDKGEPEHLWLVGQDDDGETWNIEVGPLPDDELSDWPDGDFRIYIPYYKYLPELSADADSNWFTTNAEHYIIAQAAGHGFLADWDEQRAAGWFQIATSYRKTIKNREASASVSKSRVMVPRADVYAERDQVRRS